MGLLNNKFEVFQIFPTPVYRTTLNREFLKNEKEILFNKKNFLKKNVGNKTSNNTKNTEELLKTIIINCRDETGKENKFIY